MNPHINLDHIFTTNCTPNDQEKAELKRISSEYDSQLLVISQKIYDSQKQLKDLTSKKEDIWNYASLVKRALSPFRQLPDDVVREIFVACLESKRNPTMSNLEAPVLLTQISSRTRIIALTTPTLWAAIHIPVVQVLDPDPMEAMNIMRVRATGVRVWLQRSGSLPLSISCYQPFENLARNEFVPMEIMDILVSYASRWSDMVLACSPDALGKVMNMSPSDVPLLKSFYHYAGDSGFDGSTRGWSSCTILGSQALKMYGASFRGLENLTSFAINWANLTHISFPDQSLWQALPGGMISLANILRQCHSLVSCTVHVRDSGLDDVNDIQLPFLKSLVITESWTHSPESPGIIAAIRAPRLETVSYNMDYYVQSRPASLIALLGQAPNIRDFSMGVSASTDFLLECLRHCQNLRVLHIEGLGGDASNTESDSSFLAQFVTSDQTMRLCPRLEYFRCDSSLYVTAAILRQFLIQKSGSTPHFTKWKAVVMQVYHPTIDDHTVEGLRNAIAVSGIKLGLAFRKQQQLLYGLNEGLPNGDVVHWWPGKDIWPVIGYRKRPAFTID